MPNNTASTEPQIQPTDLENEREVSLATLMFLGAVVGIVTGFGAVFFKFLIALIYNLSFLGVFSFDYSPTAHTPESPWGIGIILVPVIGGLIVVYLVENFAPEAKGHGVPEVLDAIYYKGGNVRGVVAIIKSLASAISIGTGASVGREGPFIQIGSSFGSTLSRWIGLIQSQKIILLSAGAGAGIAATFNAPLGGVLFAVEVLLPEISPRSFLPVITATATATYLYRIVLGAEAAFHLPAMLIQPADNPANFPEITLAIGVGLVMGIAAWAFIKLLAFSEDVFEAMPLNPYIQNIIGMTMVGTMGYLFFTFTGHYRVLGVGSSTIQDFMFNNAPFTITLLIAIFFGKLAATSISLGAGASGGVFSPCLLMGASLGAAIAIIGSMFFPAEDVSITTFAIIGMGAMVGASTSAAMTAVVMGYEMTRDYNMILPAVVAVAIAFAIRRALEVNDIYTIKLRNRGHLIPTDRSTNLFMIEPASRIMSDAFCVLPRDHPAFEAIESLDDGIRRIIVADGDHIVGYVRYNEVDYRSGNYKTATLGDVMRTDFTVSAATTPLNQVLTRMKRRHRGFTIVMNHEAEGVPRTTDIMGIIDRRELATIMVESHYT